ncbi:TM0106 family RecB-like putative nuclease [Pseudonocardia sp.]|uniref:TM0106 family RecB-like putative nuclease n=1 Tax=Pseudonocardia sp. TaxID=60912 RepID=UPI003D0EC0A1
MSLDAAATTRCRRRVHLDHDPAAVAAPRALPDPALEQRRADAAAHRERIASRLAEAVGSGWYAVPTAGPPAERAAATAAAVAAGAPLIWGGALPAYGTGDAPGTPGVGRRGSAELLVRLPDGGYLPVIVVHHRITDPGSGAHTTPLPDVAPHRAGPDGERRVRSHARDLLRLAHLHRMLRASGWAPAEEAPFAARAGVIGLDADVVVWHDLAAEHWPGGRTTIEEYDLRFADRAAVALAARSGGPALAAPSRINECRRCPWWPTCEAELSSVQDVSLVARGESAAALRDLGVRSVRELAEIDLEVPPGPVPGPPLGDLVALARAWLRGLAVVRRVDRVPVPRADVEVDVDMESFGESGAYLWGALLRHPGGHRDGDEADGYRAFATWEPLPTRDEARSFAEFWAWFRGVRRRAHASGRTFAAYCYNADAENRWLLGSARRFAGLPGVPPVDEIEEFIGSPEWVDVFALVGEWFLCAHGKGLKVVAPVAGFAWRDAEAGGENSMRWYRDAVGADGAPPDARQRQRLLDYNADDVAATLALREWMCSPAVEAVPLAAEL